MLLPAARRRRTGRSLLFLALFPAFAWLPTARAAQAPDRWDGFLRKPVAREAVFAFTKKPTVRKLARDRYEISFALKGRCDVAVSIVNDRGRVVRHLVYGVLGPNAPAPLRKHSLEQTLLWDGKDDFGEYVERRETLRVRVSVGLKPTFDKLMGWHPKNIVSNRRVSAIAADKDGVYVLTGGYRPQLRAFGHDGRYLRTLVPFRADKIDEFKKADLRTITLRDGYLAYYPGSGPAQGGGPYGNYFDQSFEGEATPTLSQRMACKAGRLALAGLGGLTGKVVMRIRTDGSLDGGRFYGFHVERGRYTGRSVGSAAGQVSYTAGDHALAGSPDGKWLYLTGLRGRVGGFRVSWGRVKELEPIHAVYRVPWDTRDPPAKPFIGSPAQPGSENDRLNTPTCVATDAAGNLYVADRGNNRIQMFKPDGSYLRTIKHPAPHWLDIDQKTGAIYVLGRITTGRRGARRMTFHLTKLSPAPEAKVLIDRTFTFGRSRSVPVFCIDAWADPPTVWLTHKPGEIALYADRGDSFELVHEFVKEVRADGHLPFHFGAGWRHYLSADPVRPHLYLFYGGWGTSLCRFDVRTGKYTRMKGPSLGAPADDFVIGPHGLAYIRTTGYLLRFDPTTWREVPFDYGESVGKRRYRGGLRFPWPATAHFHMGLDVSPTGDVLVLGLYSATHRDLHLRGSSAWKQMSSRRKHLLFSLGDLRPVLYPGRPFAGRGGGNMLCIWDRHGEEKFFDAVKGIPGPSSGVRGDRYGNIYLGYAARKMEGGRPVYGRSLVKFGPGGGRFIYSKGGRIPLKTPPRRPPEFLGVGQLGAAKIWTAGQALWGYGGVNTITKVGSCICPNMRFDVDFYGCVFVPEAHRCSVAVLDTNGNFILRVGRYGNADSGRGPGSPIPVGDPEIALAYCTYVAADSGRNRLYLADSGNNRIISVDLKYHAEETVPLPQPGGSEGGREEGAAVDTRRARP